MNVKELTKFSFMASISETKHKNLVKQLNTVLSVLKEDIVEEQSKIESRFLKYDLELIINLFSTYKIKIDKIHHLIKEYERIQKRARVNLRKYQKTLL